MVIRGISQCVSRVLIERLGSGVYAITGLLRPRCDEWCGALGRSWVDVAAPTGSTSDAAAVGGGLAALMVAANPSLTPEQLKAAFLNGVDVLSSTQGKVASNVRPLFYPSVSDPLRS